MIWDNQHERFSEGPTGPSDASNPRIVAMGVSEDSTAPSPFHGFPPQTTGDWSSELPIGLRSDLRALVTRWRTPETGMGAYEHVTIDRVEGWCADDLEKVIREWFGT